MNTLNNQNPLVCVCVPTYDSEATLKETLISIFAQTYRNIEILLIDNASTDKTLKIAGDLKKTDSRLKIIPFNNFVNASESYTRCINLCYGDYTAIYHSDDIYLPKIIEEEVRFLENYPKVAAVFTSAFIIDDSGETYRIRKMPGNFEKGLNYIYSFKDLIKGVFKNGSFLQTPSAMVRTTVYKEEIQDCRGYVYDTAADVDMWLRIGVNHSIGIINLPLMKYRMGVNSFCHSESGVRTKPLDIFLLMEDYICKYKGSLISDEDVRNYKFLILRDKISISLNFFLQDNSLAAKKEMRDVFTFKNMYIFFGSFYKLKILFFGCITSVLSVLPVSLHQRKMVRSIVYKK